MKQIRKILIGTIACLTLAGCRKDEISGNADDIPGLGGDVWTPTQIDAWLYENYTKPYNTDVKYKWSQTELSNINRFVTPVDEAKVIPVMKCLDSVLITPYETVTNADFMRRYLPRFIMLFGSAAYDSDGTRVQGQAEGEGRILLFELNNFRIKGMPGYQSQDSVGAKRLFLIIEHEFGHTLHMNIMYPVEFKSITGSYTSNWYNYTDGEANERGFISNYAMSGPDDDFVETLAILLVEGQTAFENRIANISSDAGRAALLQKSDAVRNYLRNAWSIDFTTLQQQTRAAIVRYTK